MGGTSSAQYQAFSETEQYAGWMKQFQAMKLSKVEVKKLYRIFRLVDVDGSGTIALAELLVHIDLDRTSFTKRIFSIFDDDKSGEIDFKEFVLALWNYCTLSTATLDMFAFDLYDTDGSGELSGGEVSRMLKDIYGGNVKDNMLAKGVEKDLRDIGDSPLNIDQFRMFAKSHQALLFPAFQMQSAAMNMSKEHDEEQYMEGEAGSGKKLKGLGDMKLKTAQELHGGHHVVSLMEVTGSRASRRQSVQRNEQKASNIEQESPLSPSSKKEMPHPQLAGFIPLEGAGYRVKPKVKQSWLGMLPGLVPGWLVSKRPESGAKPAVPAVQISVKAKVHAATESDGTPSASISKKSGKHTLTIGAMKSAEVASPIDQWASQTETKGSIRRRTLENITPPLEVPRESGRRKSTVTTVSTNATIQPYTDEALRDTGSS
eukprot:CAMPEP_0173213228 /NCGR_PEP_ID=MMETSP1141-20130122/25264_1 /TAXON_ID=483371 /ORGANISM="non described non described, Strain CCMP2298" /LENGTH=429 /DNA_ID=CAMNT_0014140385 /DNA_START=214 /DNA_END=1499 /DNA_ORIENTATION=-